jgi:hypothetical protein
MTRIRLILLSLLAVFAISAVAASAASAALPEFGRCVVKTGGKYKDSKCIEETGGGFEWEPGLVKKSFTSTSGAGTLETKGGKKVTCKADTNKGEITGAKTFGKVFVIFTGCESSGFKCNTSGAASGEIKTNELSGELGYLEKATKKVGIVLKPVGTSFAEFECSSLVKVKVTGAVVGEITPINTMTKTFTLKLEQSKGIQKWTKLEGGVESVLKTSINGGTAEQSGDESTDTITTEEEAEIKA